MAGLGFTGASYEDIFADVERGGTGAPFEAYQDSGDAINPDDSAYRQPVARVSYERVGKLVEFCIKAHDEACKARYDEWVANRKMRHETEAPKGKQANEPAHRKRYPVDVVGPIITQRNALILDQPFQVKFTPSTIEPQDAYAAEQAEALERYHDSFDEPNELRAQMLDWAVDTSGVSFAQVRLDPTAGDGLSEGVYRAEVIPTYEIGIDPTSNGSGDTRLAGTAWLFRRQFTTRAKLAAILPPEQMALVPDARAAAGVERRDTDGSEALRYLDDPSGQHDTRNRGGWGDGASPRPYRLVEYWMRRNDEWPHGCYVRYVNKTVVYVGPSPFASFDQKGFADIPFVAYCDAEYQGRFWGNALSSKLRPLQEQAITSNTSAVERDRIAAITKFIIKGVERIDKAWNTEHGQFISINNPMSSVEMMDPAPGGPERYHAVDRAERHAERIANVSQPSRGLEGSTDKTKYEVGALLGSNQVATSRNVFRLNRAHQAIARLRIFLAHGTYQLPRQLKIAGEQAGAQAGVFVGSDITGNEDIRIHSSRFVPPGPDGRIQAADALLGFQERVIAQITMARMQGIDPMIGMDEVGRILSFEVGLFDNRDRVEQLARTEAELVLTQGVPPAVTSAHDEYIGRLRVYKTYFQNRIYREALPQHRAMFDAVVDATALLAQQQRLRDMPAPPMPAEGGGEGNDKPKSKSNSNRGGAASSAASPTTQAA